METFQNSTQPRPHAHDVGSLGSSIERNSEHALAASRNYFKMTFYVLGTVALLVLISFVVRLFGLPNTYIGFGGEPTNSINIPTPSGNTSTNDTSTPASAPKQQSQKIPTVLIKIQTPQTLSAKKGNTSKTDDKAKKEVKPKITIMEMNGKSIPFIKVQIDENTERMIGVLPSTGDSLVTEELDKSEYSKFGIEAKAKRTHMKAWTYHYVRPGDSLSAVSQMYGVTRADLMKANCRISFISRRSEWLIIPRPTIYSKEN